MTYAVHLMDLQGWVKHAPLMSLLHLVMDGQVRFLNERQIDGQPVVCLNCGEEQAAAIVQVVRLKIPREKLRIYYSTTGNGKWKAL